MEGGEEGCLGGGWVGCGERGRGEGKRWDEREESNKDKNYMVRLSVICGLH